MTVVVDNKMHIGAAAPFVCPGEADCFSEAPSFFFCFFVLPNCV